MGFRLAEATNAACIRRDRGVERLRVRAAALRPFFLDDWVLDDWIFLLEDCAAASTARGARSPHSTAAIKKTLLSIECQR
jgi:hypothetical protein